MKKAFLEEITKSKLTSVVFVSGKHLENLLNGIVELSSMREISVCKELTKLNETIFRGMAADILKKIEQKKLNLKGEFVIIVSPSPKKK